MEIPDAIQHAARLLKGGGLVAFPTETVYGLGADATNATAVARGFEKPRAEIRQFDTLYLSQGVCYKREARQWRG